MNSRGRIDRAGRRRRRPATPFFAMRIASAPISSARSEAAVSVVKNGLPVPAAKMTMRRFSRCRIARRRMYGSATSATAIADWTRVWRPAARARPGARARSAASRACRRSRRWRAPSPLPRRRGRGRSSRLRRRSRRSTPPRGRRRSRARGSHDADVDAVVAVAHERLARELQQDAVEAAAGARRSPVDVSRAALTGPRARRARTRAPRRRPRQRLADRLRGVVDPLLLEQDVRAEEALVQHALDDLLARLLGLRLHLVRVRVDLALGGDDARPGTSSRAIHCGSQRRRCASRACARDRASPPRSCRSTPSLFAGGCAYAEMSRRRPPRSGRAPTTTMFSPSLRRQLDALLLELGLGADALRVDGVEHVLRVREELVVVRDRLGLAADRDHRALRAVVGEAVADLALGRLAAGALRRAAPFPSRAGGRSPRPCRRSSPAAPACSPSSPRRCGRGAP